MTLVNKRPRAYAASLIGAVIALVSIGGASLARSGFETENPACEVISTASGGGLTLEAVYEAQSAGQGSYQLSVQSVGGAGRTNINQGGGFSAKAGELVNLGRVTVGGATSYDVALKIMVDGQSHECGGRINARV